jgi:RNA polymerase sigma-70 factor (ECF subfamily)
VTQADISESPARPVPEGVEIDTALAAEVKALLAAGERAHAAARFEDLIARHQRRATRIAYYYLRESAEVDEAVQDAFLKAFLHLSSFREELLFELWFTRIVINGCLDRLKVRNRRRKWLLPGEIGDTELDLVERRPSSDPSPEAMLLLEERRTLLHAAVDRLPVRQREVVVLSQFEGHTTREVSAILSLSEATVRVHLFRAVRSLRKLLRGDAWPERAIAREAS